MPKVIWGQKKDIESSQCRLLRMLLQWVPELSKSAFRMYRWNAVRSIQQLNYCSFQNLAAQSARPFVLPLAPLSQGPECLPCPHYCAWYSVLLDHITALAMHTLCPKKSEPPKHFATATANLQRFKWNFTHTRRHLFLSSTSYFIRNPYSVSLMFN